MTSSIDHELFRYLPEQDMPVSAAAFCKQRDKLNPEALAYLNRLMVNQVPEQRRNGLRWLAIDGTTLNLPNHVSTCQVYCPMRLGICIWRWNDKIDNDCQIMSS